MDNTQRNKTRVKKNKVASRLWQECLVESTRIVVLSSEELQGVLFLKWKS